MGYRISSSFINLDLEMARLDMSVYLVTKAQTYLPDHMKHSEGGKILHGADHKKSSHLDGSKLDLWVVAGKYGRQSR